VRAAAEPGSPYARIAQVLLDLGEAFRNAQGAELLRARDSAAARLAEIEREAVPLWEVYTLLALFEQGAESSRTDYLRRAFELKPNLPLLVRLEVLQTARNTSVSEHRGVEAWNEFIDNFPYDPRGYFSRAALRFSSDSEHNYAAEVADLRKSLERNPRYADAHKLLLRVYVREGNEAAAIEHLDTMRRSQSGLDHTAINLIEAELTASTGRFDRLAVLVLSSMQENTADGIEILAQAVSVLLRDHEYEELVNLCLAVQQRLASAPPAVSLFLGRGLTMLARFDEGLERLAPLEENPGLLPRNFRGTLEGWIADAREYPVLLSSLHSVPAPRRRFDLGRILAVAGRDPDVWVPLLETQGINPNDAVNWVHPGDYVLQAKGNAMRARRAAGPQARGLRALAVQQLKDALEQGYLNRKRIYEDEYLAPLVTDEELSKFFPAG
jgi:tetratricopeptide (TPR) repeat protein